MLTAKQVNEIKEHLDKAQRPLFFFDNDPDGLCSFLLLQRYVGRGKGVPVRSFPDLNEAYFRKIQELNPDYIFIVDKPTVSNDFFKRIEEVNIPVVWIDHHEIDRNTIPDSVNYYNPLFNADGNNEPVTALAYQINPNEKLIWLAVAGCISDKYFPSFYARFKELYPDLAIDSNEAFDVFYNSQIGKVARMFSFALKDRTTNVVNMIRFLIQVETPQEVLEESGKNHTMHTRFKQIENKYRKFVNKAINVAKKSDEIIFFEYGGDLSISSDLANELSFRFSNKDVVVIYITGMKANISARGKGIRGRLVSAIKGLNDATGGGHEDAAGAQVRVEDLEIFKERMMKNI